MAKTIQWFNRNKFHSEQASPWSTKEVGSARAQRHIQRLCLGNRRMSAASIAQRLKGWGWGGTGGSACQVISLSGNLQDYFRFLFILDAQETHGLYLELNFLLYWSPLIFIINKRSELCSEACVTLFWFPHYALFQKDYFSLEKAFKSSVPPHQNKARLPQEEFHSRRVDLNSNGWLTPVRSELHITVWAHLPGMFSRSHYNYGTLQRLCKELDIHFPWVTWSCVVPSFTLR